LRSEELHHAGFLELTDHLSVVAENLVAEVVVGR
jgi:hypothetical protein